MPTEQEVLAQQKHVWNVAAAGWRTWDDLLAKLLQPTGDLMMQKAGLKPGMRVLDVATGNGEPGLGAARIVTPGRVTGTDLAPKMLELARARAGELGIENYDAVEMDAQALQFPDATFDAVLCRFSLMCFPQPELAVREMRRVLKPSGRVVITAWGLREKNAHLALLMRTVGGEMGLPPPAPDTAGFLFRHSAPGALETIMKNAGLVDVDVQGFEWPSEAHTPETVWRASKEVSPMAAMIASAPPSVQANIEKKMIEALTPLAGSDGQLSYLSHAWIGTGAAP